MAELITAIVLAMLVIFVIVVIAGIILQGRRRHRVQGGDWQSRALEACAAADALHDRIETKLTLAENDGEGPAAPADRWGNTERGMEQLAAKLYTLRFSAPNYTTDQATEELIMALAALRSALPVGQGALPAPPVPAGEPVSTAQARLMELDSAVRALRAAI